jgi:hypothetical protein
MSMKHLGSRGLVILSMSMVVCACSVANGEASTLQPVDVSQFIVPAEESVGLEFQADAQFCHAGVAYVVQDYVGAEEGKGVVHCNPGSTVLELPLKLHRGYHEIRFPAANATYGVIALDQVNDPVSNFFGVDTAFSYLESSPRNRSQFVNQLKRLGIGSVRDRINWNELRPDQGAWNGSGQHQFDDLRQLYAKAGIKVLDVLQGLPEGPATYFPSSATTVAAVSQMAAHWGKVWSGVEVANEPDHNPIYDKLTRGERSTYQLQYADYASLVSKDVKRSAPDVPIVGGAFAYALTGGKLDSSKFASGVTAVGLLRSVNAISFHTYVDAMALQRDIASFKDWLHRSGAANMPLWITESGWPWKRGPGRPSLDQDQTSALQIAGKAVMAYGMGIQRYYAFVYPYYEEKAKNFGMTGKERTPLRSLASYEQVAKTLSGTSVLSLAGVNDDGFGALFKTPVGVVMVVYDKTGPQGSSWLSIPFPVLKAEGIDGRPLVVDGGKLSLADGLVYVWIADADVPKAKEILGKRM